MNHSSDSRTVSLLRGVARAALVLWALLTFLPPAPATAADTPSPVIEQNEPPLNVLLLFASPRLTPAQIALDEAFRSTLTTRLSSPIYFYTEYLDLTLFDGDEPRPELRALLKQKYGPVSSIWSSPSRAAGCASPSRIARTSSRARRSCSPA